MASKFVPRASITIRDMSLTGQFENWRSLCNHYAKMVAEVVYSTQPQVTKQFTVLVNCFTKVLDVRTAVNVSIHVSIRDKPALEPADLTGYLRPDCNSHPTQHESSNEVIREEIQLSH